ncbi:MAG: regulator [Sulfurimonas sp. RIFCSPLOWO2_12_FULL_36_74]|uniref:response regulator transcription factor n=1 Tax=Sulfurimonas sp. RIFCSPLOWO2_12_36_12 TaxID=1802253 RepID=UPI0008CD1031|nr:response regulator transcription factor [Sulfurimonas sp. RIFCSPLOWO2_12_36_12]OHD98330.1 MAG: regulator [Sulfurimonas sp. RIFCSPLOWO2_02_FULL_36_28]OHE01788.1 MAG: regulator [Sulfurimonas sp. RIFCSPLOWO2_12_36_12]OHE07165.1 MAG: regulator [Sulfurimonas sp. RIFCSPLOWO2_12_FULL_36_74]
MKKRILLLEDDLVLGQTLVELLVSEGYSVTLAKGGDEAVDATYENRFDLYIFDINVPDINGLELLKSLRDADDKTPTVFISALVDLGSISKAFEVGAEDYIKKPFFPQELLIRVNAKLAQKNSTIKYNDLEYNPKTKTLKKGLQTIALGEVQEQLFSLFIKNIGKVLTQDMLLECLEKPSSSALRVALTKLKQTTGLNIKNLRAIGYIVE